MSPTPLVASAQASRPSASTRSAPAPASIQAAGSISSTPGTSLRAAFYYPWFPEAWNQQRMNPFTLYHPSLGFYSSSDLAVIAAHIAAMRYGQIQVGIASWWGQGTKTDTRIPLLLSAARGTGFKWALYYEPALTAAGVVSDLAYINQHYGGDPNFLRVDGKPVVFVYTRGVSSCADVATWTANNPGDYLNLQVFVGYRTCTNQPDSWHQYGPASRTNQQDLYSFSISPGYAKATDPAPLLARDPAAFGAACQQMMASGATWQLVTTFNEWGEGTAVESAGEWPTASGYGAYLDALHTCPASPLPTPPSTTSSGPRTQHQRAAAAIRVPVHPKHVAARPQAARTAAAASTSSPTVAPGAVTALDTAPPPGALADPRASAASGADGLPGAGAMGLGLTLVTILLVGVGFVIRRRRLDR